MLKKISLLLIALLILVDEYELKNYGNNGEVEAKINVTYKKNITRGYEAMYHYNFTSKLFGNNETVRLTVSSPGATDDHPTIFVVRMSKGVLSWTVPLITEEKKKYNSVSHTLCPALYDYSTDEKWQDFYVDVSTSNIHPMEYTLKAFLVQDFELRLDTPRIVAANPAEPLYYQYRFRSSQERVAVRAESNTSTCMTLLIQNTRCPLTEQGQIENAGMYATMTKKASIVVRNTDIAGPSF